MSDEKLLEYFKSDDIHLIQCDHKWCNAYGYEKLQMKKDILDRVTNLQRENEKLKNFITTLISELKHCELNGTKKLDIVSDYIKQEYEKVLNGSNEILFKDIEEGYFDV